MIYLLLTFVQFTILFCLHGHVMLFSFFRCYICVYLIVHTSAVPCYLMMLHLFFIVAAAEVSNFLFPLIKVYKLGRGVAIYVLTCVLIVVFLFFASTLLVARELYCPRYVTLLSVALSTFYQSISTGQAKLSIIYLFNFYCFVRIRLISAACALFTYYICVIISINKISYCIVLR